MTLGQLLINLACEENFYPREQDFARKISHGKHFWFRPSFREAKTSILICFLTESGYNHIYVVSALAQNICFFSL